MGQSHTTLQKSLDRQNSISQSGYDEPSGSVESQENCCLFSMKSTHSKELTWKNYMIKQLNQSECSKWPEILIKGLKGYSDVNRVSIRRKLPGVKQNRAQMSPSDLLKPEKKHSEAISVNNNDEDSFIVNNMNYEKQINTAIKEILDDSVILEENLIPTNYIEICEPKSTEDNKMRISTPFASGYSQDFSRSNYARSHSSLYSNNRNFESYKNNTILNQFNPGIRLQAVNSSQTIEQKGVEACILYFKQVTTKIEADIRQRKNVFSQMMSLFETFFIKHYKKIVDQKDKEGGSQFKKIVQKALRDIQGFIYILANGINMFYDLQSLKQGKLDNGYCVFNYDNIFSFVSTLVLNERLYNLVFQLSSIESYPTEKLYRSKLEQCNKLSPQDFGVLDEYCLNEKSLHIKDKSALVDDRRTSIFSNSSLSEGPILQRQNPSQNKSFEFYLKSHESVICTKGYEPYEKAITTLKGLRYQKSPIHKLKVILKTVELVTISIDEFYQKLDIKNTQNLAGEHVFAILCYIVSKSAITNILAHCRIIYELSTPNIRSSMSGYYATTLEACMKHICYDSFK